MCSILLSSGHTTVGRADNCLVSAGGLNLLCANSRVLVCWCGGGGGSGWGGEAGEGVRDVRAGAGRGGKACCVSAAMGYESGFLGSLLLIGG